MKPQTTLRAALDDLNLLGNVLRGSSWSAWRTMMIAMMGEPLDDDERMLFAKLTGRECEPLNRVEEFVGVIGRRGGKSRAMATLAVYIAGLCDHALVRGERGVLLLIAPDQRQAAIGLDYATATLEQSPILRQLIANRSADALELTNGISIEVRASSFRRLRGPTYVGVIADEAAFWMSDEFSSNADVEILNAVRPGLATTGGPLIVASSPYARRGVLWDAYKKHYGAAGDPLVLVAQGASRDFNPSLPQRVVDRALERDHASASAEYLATFRTDIENFVAREAVDACVDRGVRERAPAPGANYIGFTDPSGGSSDSMVTAIGHVDNDILIVDAIREIHAPFDPESAVDEFTRLLKLYGIIRTSGDKYAAQWVAQSFEKRLIQYEHCEQNKSQLYLEMLPRINAKTVRLLDHPRSINQICNLERRTVRGGRDSIDHPPNSHDDCANAIAGLCGLAGVRKYRFDSTYNWVRGDGNDPEAEAAAAAEYQKARLSNHIMRGSFQRGWR